MEELYTKIDSLVEEFPSYLKIDYTGTTVVALRTNNYLVQSLVDSLGIALFFSRIEKGGQGSNAVARTFKCIRVRALGRMVENVKVDLYVGVGIFHDTGCVLGPIFRFGQIFLQKDGDGIAGS